MDHYLQVRDEDIDAAVSKASRRNNPNPPAETPTQKPTWQPRATLGNEKQRNALPSEHTSAQTSNPGRLIAKLRQLSDTEQIPNMGPGCPEQFYSLPIVYSKDKNTYAKTDFFENTGDSDAIDLHKEVESLPPELQAAVLGILMSNHRKRA